MSTANEAAHEAARKAVDGWISKGDAKSGRELRDALHALAAAGNTRTASLKPAVMKTKRPKRRAVA